MCDWCSWIKKNGKVYYLTDDMIRAKWPDANVRDKIGHSAIEEYYPEARGGEHIESPIKLPPEIAVEVNKGHCDAMLKAGGWAGARYTRAGNINSSWLVAVKKIIKEVKKIKWMANHSINPEWKVFETRDAAWDAASLAARDASSDTARDAAWYASRDAASDVAWYASRHAAQDAASNAAWDAAQDAASNAAWDAAGDAARDAASDAALLVMCAVAFFDDPENKYKYAQSRMDVWRAGYGLLCDIDGVFYVYKKP